MTTWIPAGENNPKDGQTVLCYWPGSAYCGPSMQSLTYRAADEHDGHDAWMDVFGETDDAPSHWTPLPEAP